MNKLPPGLLASSHLTTKSRDKQSVRPGTGKQQIMCNWSTLEINLLFTLPHLTGADWQPEFGELVYSDLCKVAIY